MQAIIATAVDTVVAIIVGPIMLVGLVPPAEDKIPMVVAGIRVTEDVLMAKTLPWHLLQYPFYYLTFAAPAWPLILRV